MDFVYLTATKIKKLNEVRHDQRHKISKMAGKSHQTIGKALLTNMDFILVWN